MATAKQVRGQSSSTMLDLQLFNLTDVSDLFGEIWECVKGRSVTHYNLLVAFLMASGCCELPYDATNF